MFCHWLKRRPNESVSEQYLLDIEREVFVSLCGEQKTVDRIGFMLKKRQAIKKLGGFMVKYWSAIFMCIVLVSCNKSQSSDKVSDAVKSYI